MNICYSCKRTLGDHEIRAVCSCGDLYCRKCIEDVFTEKELEAVIKDAKTKGHDVTLK